MRLELLLLLLLLVLVDDIVGVVPLDVAADEDVAKVVAAGVGAAADVGFSSGAAGS